MVKYKPLRK